MSPVKNQKRAAVASKAVTPKSGKKRGRGGGGVERKWQQYTHMPPSRAALAQNGRKVGRNLITWNRPRMYEKLLLHIQYECARHRIDIPWENVAHRLNPGSSAQAVTQHLNRLRSVLIAEGHMVPPSVEKRPSAAAFKQDPSIRGYVRQNQDNSEDFLTTRAVGWNEPVEDLKKPLGDAAYALDGAFDGEDDGGDDSIVFESTETVQKGKKAPKDESSDEDSLYSSRITASVSRPSRAAARKVRYAEDEDEDIKDCDEEDEEDVYVDEDADEHEETHQSSMRTTTTRDASSVPVAKAAPQPVKAATSTPVRPQSGLPPNFDSKSPGYMPTAVLITPDGRSWTIPNLSVGGVAKAQPTPMPPFMASLMEPETPMRRGGFATVDSSPADFNLASATPGTAAAMKAHINEWNSNWNDELDVNDMFKEPSRPDTSLR